MAATVNAWGKPGAWALDSEENEAELLNQKKDDLSTGHNSEAGAVVGADFPSLSVAAATKTKKKKPQTLSLQEFTTYGAGGNQSTTAASQGLTPEELLALPTGPRQRTAEELEQRRGFRSFDTRNFRDEPRRQQRESNREFAPSRADEIDDWASTKKSSFADGPERRGRGSFFSDSQSRADEVDNWASNKSFVPSDGRRYDNRRGSGFGSNNGAADSDNWLKKKEEEGPKIGNSFNSLRSRRGSNESLNGPDADTWGRKREEVSNGATRPKLNLQPRTKPLSEVQQNDEKPKASNPFGAARPREDVLKEKGQDWKEIDEKLEAVKIKEVAKPADGPAFERRGFGSGNGRGILSDDRTERTWRKPEQLEASPTSSEKSEHEHVEEIQEKERQA